MAIARPVSLLYDAWVYTNTASWLLYLSAGPCLVFRAIPQPELEGDIDTPVDLLHVPIQLNHVHMTSTSTSCMQVHA